MNTHQGNLARRKREEFWGSAAIVAGFGACGLATLAHPLIFPADLVSASLAFIAGSALVVAAAWHAPTMWRARGCHS